MLVWLGTFSLTTGTYGTNLTSPLPIRVRSADRIKLFAQQVTTVALDLLFPPHCVNCERVGSFLCPRCYATITQAPERHVSGLDGVRVRANFEGAISAAIHAFKYNHNTRLVEPLGHLLSEAVQDAAWSIDLVTAVPLHPNRLRERGYNQAALLGQHLAQANNWLFDSAVVSRVRETSSQVKLNAQERRTNVDGAFAAEAQWVAGRKILVIDDVLTTGSTLVACADALRAAGATQVYGAAVAGAVYSDSDQRASDAPVS